MLSICFAAAAGKPNTATIKTSHSLTLSRIVSGENPTPQLFHWPQDAEASDASTGDMVFGVASLIAYISQFTVLAPGDVISTGTPGGVGARRDPPLWMKDGDTVEVEISGIGTLTNPVVAE